MKKDFNYRLTAAQKSGIAKDLVNALEHTVRLSQPAASFVRNWILTGPDEKYKAFYDVWDIVLHNYMPTQYPILFRACTRRANGRIASFTGRLEAARRFLDGKGFLLFCDTKEALPIYQDMQKGAYRHTFYPLGYLLEQEAGFPDSFLSPWLCSQYRGEDEYIMRINTSHMHSLKWCGNKGA